MPNMDSDWKCLIDEMWESYLCEENIGSFYDPTSTDPFSNIHDVQYDQAYALNETLFLDNTVQNCPIYRENWEPLDNLFDLMEEVALFSGIEEKQEEKNFVDPRLSRNEVKTKTQQKKKNTKDAETNTRKIQKKPKTGEKRKRSDNQKSLNQNITKLKKKK